ncbi:MAG: type II toxin-antitoxin system prevent-host-death family antitoxin [Actinomycetota bacterium]|nr:type II toxin-antitoxin system prevent-host-death family antitoxin [Actinomycetota bacterium]MDA8280914.1 type II toxin-antitoxin system prevent-host-death family antitoxin [Actinomycetota bacterium]
MTRIGVRELRQHASRYLAQVKAGDVVEVTERGKLVALLVSPTPAVAGRERLIASGHLIPAKTAFFLPARRHVAEPLPTASDVLSELRQERLG